MDIRNEKSSCPPGIELPSSHPDFGPEMLRHIGRNDRSWLVCRRGLRMTSDVARYGPNLGSLLLLRRPCFEVVLDVLVESGCSEHKGCIWQAEVARPFSIQASTPVAGLGRRSAEDRGDLLTYLHVISESVPIVE